MKPTEIIDANETYRRTEFLHNRIEELEKWSLKVEARLLKIELAIGALHVEIIDNERKKAEKAEKGVACELCGIEGICFCRLFNKELVQKWVELKNEREESDAITLLESRGFEVWRGESYFLCCLVCHQLFIYHPLRHIGPRETCVKCNMILILREEQNYGR